MAQHGDRRITKKSAALDGAMPSAMAALKAKRQSLRALQEIDDLLSDEISDDPNKCLDSRKSGQKSREEQSSDDIASPSPCPGANDPHHDHTKWRRNAAVAMHRQAPPHSNTKAALLLRQFTRATNTPGPGAYNVQAADCVVKPRISSAPGFAASLAVSRSNQATIHNVVEDAVVLDVARADKWLSRHRPPKGAVAYVSSGSSSSSLGRSREQRDKLRRIKLATTRHTRIGFYSVQYALTEPRTGAVGVVSMAKTARQSQREDSCQVHAHTRRKFRAYRRAAEAASHRQSTEQQAQVAVAPEPKSKSMASERPTVQWQRAQARVLFKQQTLRQRVEQKRPASLQPPRHSRGLDAHVMAKHSGRDSVRCRQKSVRVVTCFSSQPAKDTSKEDTSCSTRQAPPRGGAAVAFDKMLGRDEATMDADGVYLVGLEHVTPKTTDLMEWSDAAVRPRVLATIIHEPHVSTQAREPVVSILSPQYDLLSERVRGHAYVRFENQLDRHERARPKTFTAA